LLILSPIIHPSTKEKGARYGIVIWLRDWNVAKLALLLGIAIIAGSTLDWDNLLQVMNGRIAVAILVMQIPLFGATLLNACRHSFLITSPRAPLKPCLAAILLSAGINLITPGRISEIVKATYLCKKLHLPLSNGTAAIMVERLFDVLIVSAIALIGFTGVYFGNTTIPTITLGIAISGLLLIKPISQRVMPFLSRRADRISVFLYCNFIHANANLRWRFSFATLLLTSLSWLLHYVAFWLFFAVQPGYDLDFSQAAMVFGALIYAGAVPALPGGIGMIQAAVTFCLTQIGIPLIEALALSLALHVSEVLISLVISPFILLSQPIGIRDLINQLNTKANT